MKKYSWLTVLTTSAMALAFSACTITTSDPEDGGPGPSNTGGKAGAGGAAGTDGGQAGGAAGTDGGQTGGAAGTDGGQTGGAAGTAGTGGAGPATKTCKEKFPQFEKNSCHECLVSKCCNEVEACINKAKKDTDSSSCNEKLDCVYNKCTDPGNFQTCSGQCSNINDDDYVEFNEAASCLEPASGKCGNDCQASG